MSLNRHTKYPQLTKMSVQYIIHTQNIPITYKGHGLKKPRPCSPEATWRPSPALHWPGLPPALWPPLPWHGTGRAAL